MKHLLLLFWGLKACGSKSSTFIKTASLKSPTVCCLSSWTELFILLRRSNNSQSRLKRNHTDASQTQPTPAAYSLWPYCEIRNRTGVTIMSGLLSAHSKYMVNGLQREELVISQTHLQQQKQQYPSSPEHSNKFLWKMPRSAPSNSKTLLFVYLQVKMYLIKRIGKCKQPSHCTEGHPITVVTTV